VTLKEIAGITRAAFASAVMFLAGAVVPLLGSAAMIFAPAPLLGYAVGFPRPMMRLAGVVMLSSGLVAAGAGISAAAAYALSFGLAAAVMCYLLERRDSLEWIVLATTSAIVVTGAVAAFAFAGSPLTLAAALHQQLVAGMMRGASFYKAIGIDAAMTPEMQAYVVDAAIRLAPALVVISSAFIVLLNLAVFWRVSGKQQRVGYMLFGDLARWSTPEWLVWPLLISGFGWFIPVPPLAAIAMNCFVCVTALYFCQGIAILAFYFRQLGMPPLARGLIYFVTIVQPVLAALVCAAGIFDLWIDFRRLKPRSPEARNLGNFL
jgi:uncharacterized protein YybS (DUF2232 family)